MIDILIPVLGRPDSADRAYMNARHGTVAMNTVIFICTRGDHAEIEACKKTGAVVLLVDEPGYAAKINQGALSELSRGEFVFLGADDLNFHREWDTIAIDRFHETRKPVIGTNDLGNPTVKAGRHATHSLVHRSYIERGTIDEPWKLLHEGYDHNWVDTEFVETAMSRDAFTFAADSHVEHLHPFWRKGPTDVIYERGQKHYHRDGQLFRQRRTLWRERGR